MDGFEFLFHFFAESSSFLEKKSVSSFCFVSYFCFSFEKMLNKSSVEFCCIHYDWSLLFGMVRVIKEWPELTEAKCNETQESTH